MDSELLNEERNIMLLVLLALKAYQVEESEAFNVDTATVNAVIEDALSTGDSVPEISISTEDSRTYFVIGFREPTEEEVQQITIKGEKE